MRSRRYMFYMLDDIAIKPVRPMLFICSSLPVGPFLFISRHLLRRNGFPLGTSSRTVVASSTRVTLRTSPRCSHSSLTVFGSSCSSFLDRSSSTSAFYSPYMSTFTRASLERSLGIVRRIELT